MIRFGNAVDHQADIIAVARKHSRTRLVSSMDLIECVGRRTLQATPNGPIFGRGQISNSRPHQHLTIPKGFQLFARHENNASGNVVRMDLMDNTKTCTMSPKYCCSTRYRIFEILCVDILECVPYAVLAFFAVSNAASRSSGGGLTIPRSSISKATQRSTPPPPRLHRKAWGVFSPSTSLAGAASPSAERKDASCERKAAS